MLAGILQVAAVTAGGAAVIAVVLYAPAVVRTGRRLGIRLGVLAPDEPVLPQPVERVARDVRRIRADLVVLDPQTPVARRRGLLAAYDDALADACRALGLPDLLSDIPDGVERELARLEVEQELVEAGLIPGRTPGR